MSALNKKERLNKKVVIILLVAIILFHIFNNYAVIKNNKAPLYHTPIVPLIIFLESHTPFSSIYENFGIGIKDILLFNTFFLIILILSVYGIGAELHSRKAGLLSAFIVTTFPHIFGLSRYYGQRFILLSAIAVSIFFLLKTNKFNDLKYSIFFGLAVGFAMFARFEFAIYLIGPFLLYTYYSFFPNNKLVKINISSKIRCLFLSFASFTFFILITGAYNLARLREGLFSMSIDTRSMPNFDAFFYLKSLIGIQTLHYYAFLFFLSIVLLSFRKRKQEFFFLLSWYSIPLVYYTFIVYKNQNISLMLTTLPAVALIISIFLLEIKNKDTRLIFIFLTISIGLIQFFTISYLLQVYPYIGKINSGLKIDIHDTGIDFFNYNPEYGSNPFETMRLGFIHAYDSDWGVEGITEIISNSLEDKNKHIKIIGCDILIIHLITGPLQPYLYTNNIKNFEAINIEPPKSYENIELRPPTYKHLDEIDKKGDELLRDSDYIIFTDTPMKDPKIEGFIDKAKKKYKPIGNVTLPDKTLIYVYKNEKQRLSNTS